MADENVKVAVRTRAFNQREKDAKSKLVVQMSGPQTIIRDPKTNEEKKFTFDYSYWSHDGFKIDSTGYMSPESPKYADQVNFLSYFNLSGSFYKQYQSKKKVYNDLGVGILKNAWAGYNASLFAYGQTGSGKSYSVVGYGTNRGIVPMLCEEIFSNKSPISGATTEVTFSMLEIYSEVVRDLLNSKADRKNSLTVREDSKIGFYPQGQTKALVSSYAEISKLMDEGTANRTIAATNMNATSSRAHTIVTINLVQKYKNEAGKEMAKSSLINLVDLAGSERADATGATGDRLKEGAAINLSLTSLGNVIAALADNSSGKNVRVPYRDSVLTKLLMNALGGNSKTIMIAAISPADINFDESVSTLRYADRAKQIKTKAVVNEDPTEKLIADLKAENARLKKLLESGGKLDASDAGKDGKDDDSEALKKAVEENNKAMEAMQKSYEEKLAEAKKQTENLSVFKTVEQSKTIPHLRNVNMDPTLSGMIRHLLDKEGEITIGKPGSTDIGLNGLGILEKHGTITNNGGKYTLTAENGAKLLKNGVQVTSSVELNHLDRLLFGTSQYFLISIPSKAKPNDPYYTFEMMQDEIGKASGLITKDTKNMSSEEIKCQSELVDLVPAIEEANMFSIELDKKLVFAGLPVPAEARGDNHGPKLKAYVSVKNFALNLEWIWPKETFLDRKAAMSEFYLDLKDGTLDLEKNKKNDPFNISPDSAFQVGSAMVFLKSFANLIAASDNYKILNMKSKDAGSLNVEIMPCNSEGNIIDTKSIKISNPKKDLLNKNLNFILKINELKGLDPAYEDVYCQFKIFNDPTVYKTSTVKGDKGFNFKFVKQFSFVATKEFLDYILNKTLFIQIWAEQKHTKPNPEKSKLTTKEYYERLKNTNKGSLIIGREIMNNYVDPEKAKLLEELKILKFQKKNDEFKLKNIEKLSDKFGKTPITSSIINSVVKAKDDDEADGIITSTFEGIKKELCDFPSELMRPLIDLSNDSMDESNRVTNSVACNIM